MHIDLVSGLACAAFILLALVFGIAALWLATVIGFFPALLSGIAALCFFSLGLSLFLVE